jgi:hypothetical protein
LQFRASAIAEPPVTEQDKRASTRTSRIIKAPPEALYGAFFNPAVLIT